MRVGLRFLVALLSAAVVASAVPPLEPLARGQLVVARSWLPPELTQRLRADAIGLRKEGAFVSSGLSNTAKGDKTKQGFGLSDRAVCAVTPELAGDRAARAEFQRLLDGVQNELRRDRPGLVCAEQYYSVSSSGAALARHMDERHEELKGARGWSKPYRRSISWLAYLCEPGWDEESGPGGGGALRAFVRDGQPARGVTCSAHDGNLQVGWSAAERCEAAPVYLDAWLPVEVPGYAKLTAAQKRQTPRFTSLASLYRVGSGGRREYISDAVEGGGAHTIDELVTSMGADERRRFAPVNVPIEATRPPPGSYEMTVPPLGGTLLLFDSVSVSHEVLATTAGERWAMAGWFHQPTQEVPTWL